MTDLISNGICHVVFKVQMSVLWAPGCVKSIQTNASNQHQIVPNNRYSSSPSDPMKNAPLFQSSISSSIAPCCNVESKNQYRNSRGMRSNSERERRLNQKKPCIICTAFFDSIEQVKSDQESSRKDRRDRSSRASATIDAPAVSCSTDLLFKTILAIDLIG